MSALLPASDPGRFDLKVGTTVVAEGAGDGERGGLFVDRGSDVRVGQAGAGLAAYDSSIDCGGGPRDGASVSTRSACGLASGVVRRARTG